MNENEVPRDITDGIRRVGAGNDPAPTGELAAFLASPSSSPAPDALAVGSARGPHQKVNAMLKIKYRTSMSRLGTAGKIGVVTGALIVASAGVASAAVGVAAVSHHFTPVTAPTEVTPSQDPTGPEPSVTDTPQTANEQPDANNTEQPDANNTEQPDADNTEQPDAENSDKADHGDTEQPDASNSDKADHGDTDQSGTGNSDKADHGDTDQSGTGNEG